MGREQPPSELYWSHWRPPCCVQLLHSSSKPHLILHLLQQGPISTARGNSPPSHLSHLVFFPSFLISPCGYVRCVCKYLLLLESSAANRKGSSKDETYWKEINAAMALTNLAQGKDKLQGTTSCIIQKSSHISEVKTVKVPLVQQF